MGEIGHVFKTQLLIHDGQLQTTPGCSVQETKERGGDCGKVETTDPAKESSTRSPPIAYCHVEIQVQGGHVF